MPIGNGRAKVIQIVDDHHKVLKHWADYRRVSDTAPRLITLDHHTDTSKPFRKVIGKNAKEKNLILSEEEFLKIQDQYLIKTDYKNEDQISWAIENLSHDEHIVAALKTNIISSAFVIAHNAMTTDIEIFERHKIMCVSIPNVANESGVLVPDNKNAISDEHLKQSIEKFNLILKQADQSPILESPYILDIDLDYFNTFDSVKPLSAEFFKFIAKKASLITIATEPEYVKLCSIDKDLTAEYLLNEVLSLIN